MLTFEWKVLSEILVPFIIIGVEKGNSEFMNRDVNGNSDYITFTISFSLRCTDLITTCLKVLWFLMKSFNTFSHK